MATALASLVTGRPVRADTAMTGELTLTGRVLPIGGLKEKALAAQRAGITRVIAPKLNQPDLQDFPPHLVKDIEFVWVDTHRPRDARGAGARRRSCPAAQAAAPSAAGPSAPASGRTARAPAPAARLGPAAVATLRPMRPRRCSEHDSCGYAR